MANARTATSRRNDSDGLRPAKRHPLVEPSNFLLATRDTGYKSTALAVAELIDNAVQAGATHVDVDVLASEDPDFPIELRVSDDGTGMDADVLAKALTFGGSSRFDDRSSLGRYGMGLPNGALSRARRVEAFSWRGDQVLMSYLDVDEIVREGRRSLPPALPVERPTFLPQTSSGTVVRLLRCDRLEYRRPTTLANRLAQELSRIFRVFLGSGLRLTVNGAGVDPVDPLFLDRAGRAAGARPFGDLLQYRLEGPHGSGLVEVRFSELPIERWHVLSTEEKRRRGITNSPVVSVLRAGREIDRGWLFMGSKRRENYDDWWRCEVRFEPSLDELFGITHSKQTVVPSAEVLAALESDLESIGRALNARVRQRFEMVKVATPLSSAESQAARAHGHLPRLPRRGDPLSPELEELLLTLSAGGADSRPYQLAVSELPSTAAFEVAVRDQRLLVVLNSRHPLYRDIYGPLAGSEVQRDQEVAARVALTLLAAGRAEYLGSRRANRVQTRQFRQAWSDVLATFLNA